jgi:hypothetical protein
LPALSGSGSLSAERSTSNPSIQTRVVALKPTRRSAPSRARLLAINSRTSSRRASLMRLPPSSRWRSKARTASRL